MHPFRPTIHARISSCSATLRAPCSSMNRYSSRLEVSPSLFCVEGPHPSTQLYCYSQSYTDAHSRYSDQFGFHSHWSLVLVYVRSKIDKRVLDWKWKWSCTYEQLFKCAREGAEPRVRKYTGSLDPRSARKISGSGPWPSRLIGINLEGKSKVF